MAKTETVHTRVSPNIKSKADEIYKSLGLTTSQAVMLFLVASVNCNGLPFDLKLGNDVNTDFDFAKAIVTVDGVEPSKDAERIMKLYSNGDIDYETACFAIKRIVEKENKNG